MLSQWRINLHVTCCFGISVVKPIDFVMIAVNYFHVGVFCAIEPVININDWKSSDDISEDRNDTKGMHEHTHDTHTHFVVINK